MIKFKFDKETGITIVAPSIPLARKAFLSLAEQLDSSIEKA